MQQKAISANIAGTVQLPVAVQTPSQSYDNKKLAEYASMLRKEYSLNNEVLLVQVPQCNFKSFNVEVARNRGYYAYPPAGLQCVAKALSNRNLKVSILDLDYEFLKRLISDESFDYHNWLGILDEYLEEHNPSIIGGTCISVSEVFTGVHPFTNLLEYLHKRDDKIVIGGGVIATNEYESYLKKDLCHFVVDGEGENKVNFLFDNLYNKAGEHLPTPNIYFRYNERIEQTNGPKDEIDLRGTIVSTYDLIPIETYCKVGSLNPYSRLAGRDTPFSTIQLVRGCRADCMFCGVTKFMGRGTRHYPTKDLLAEIKYLVEKRGVRHFEWLDDDLLADKKDAAEVLKGMADIRKQYGITWAANNGLIGASLDEETLALIRDSGCVGFRIGIETGSSQMLKRIRKPATLDLLRAVCERINKFPEMFVGANYIIGLFGEETFGQMMDTLSFSYETNLDWASFATFQFTSKETIEQEHLNFHGKEITEFVPAKDDMKGEIVASEGIATGPELFELPKDSIPSPEQVRHIWFGFNVLINYINNKNLKPGGKPEKFILWVEAVRPTYPRNSYMPLFIALGYTMLGKKELAGKYLAITKKNLKASQYWRSRFDQYSLSDIVNNFPKTPEGVQEVLEPLRDRYLKYVKQ